MDTVTNPTDTENTITQASTGIITDMVVGHLRIVRVVHRRALAKCRCGKVCEFSIEALQSGEATSCGCSANLKNTRRDEWSARLPNWKPERGR